MLSKWQKITIGVVVGAVVLLGLYDIAAAISGGKQATISVFISWMSQQWWGATIVFSLGYLMGHFFAQDKPVDF